MHLQASMCTSWPGCLPCSEDSVGTCRSAAPVTACDEQLLLPLPLINLPTRRPYRTSPQFRSSILGCDDNDLREAALAVAQQLAADDGSLRLMQQPVRAREQPCCAVHRSWLNGGMLVQRLLCRF